MLERQSYRLSAKTELRKLCTRSANACARVCVKHEAIDRELVYLREFVYSWGLAGGWSEAQGKGPASGGGGPMPRWF